jgi:outer membrane protein OmpA-like peptidoglycan-associated protein
MQLSKPTIFALTGLAMIVSEASAAKVPQSEKAELSAVIYKYNMGDVVGVQLQPNQHVICDTCPKSILLAGYKEPVVNKLKLSDMPAGEPQAKSKDVPVVEINNPETGTTATAKDKTLATIQFKLDSSRLDKKGAAEISRLAKELKEQGGEVFVRVDGYTCKLGLKKHNDRLAMKRAQAVGERLKRHGIKVTRTTGEGVCCYVDNKHLEPNRRVEILETKSIQGVNSGKPAGMSTNKEEGSK